MSAPRIKSLRELRNEMLAVASGEMNAPVDAHEISFESAQAVTRLLTDENRTLLRTIDSKNPASVAELAQLVHRAESNVSRSLANLVEAGFVIMQEGKGKTKKPEVAVRRITIEIDVLQPHDQLRTFA